MSKMSSHCYLPSILGETATKTCIEEFLSLIKRVYRQLVAEAGTVGTLQITGRLIEAQPVGEAIIVGDLHGDLQSLVQILNESKFLAKMKNNQNVLIIFLGDYGDRGLSWDFFPQLVKEVKELADNVCHGRYVVGLGGGSRFDIADYITPKIVRILGEIES